GQRRAGRPGPVARATAGVDRPRRPGGINQFSLAGGSAGEAGVPAKGHLDGADEKAGDGDGRREAGQPAGAERETAGGRTDGGRRIGETFEGTVMTRETKLGLAVAVAFLALVGGVLTVKLTQGEGQAGADDPTQVADTKSLEPPQP